MKLLSLDPYIIVEMRLFYQWTTFSPCILVVLLHQSLKVQVLTAEKMFTSSVLDPRMTFYCLQSITDKRKNLLVSMIFKTNECPYQPYMQPCCMPWNYNRFRDLCAKELCAEVIVCVPCSSPTGNPSVSAQLFQTCQARPNDMTLI